MLDLNSLLEPILDILVAGIFLAIYHADSPAPIVKPKPVRAQAMRMQPTASLAVDTIVYDRVSPAVDEWVADPMDGPTLAGVQLLRSRQELDRVTAALAAGPAVRSRTVRISSKVTVKDLRKSAADLLLPAADCRLPKAALKSRLEEVLSSLVDSDYELPDRAITDVELAVLLHYCCN